MSFSKIIRYVIFVLLVALVVYFYKQIANFLMNLFRRKATSKIVDMSVNRPQKTVEVSQKEINEIHSQVFPEQNQQML